MWGWPSCVMGKEWRRRGICIEEKGQFMLHSFSWLAQKSSVTCTKGPLDKIYLISWRLLPHLCTRGPSWDRKESGWVWGPSVGSWGPSVGSWGLRGANFWLKLDLENVLPGPVELHMMWPWCPSEVNRWDYKCRQSRATYYSLASC